MDITERLKRMREEDRALERMLDDLEQMTARVELAAVSYQHARIKAQHGCREEVMAVLIDRRNAAAQKMLEVTEEKHALYNLLRTLEDRDLSIILAYRYLMGQSWESIAETMEMDRSSVQRKAKKGIDLLSKIGTKTVLKI